MTDDKSVNMTSAAAGAPYDCSSSSSSTHAGQMTALRAAQAMFASASPPSPPPAIGQRE